MSHRDDLLDAAKRLLYEKGYSRITARDLVTASGTNLASIGYHYGSKDALLQAAILATFDDWDAELVQAAKAVHGSGGTERLGTYLVALMEIFQRHRPMIAASTEALAQAEHLPEVREQLAEGFQNGRSGLAALFLGVPEDQLDDTTVRTAGSFLMALVNGLALQWLIDPDRAPSGADMAAGLAAVLDLAPRPDTGEAGRDSDTGDTSDS